MNSCPLAPSGRLLRKLSPSGVSISRRTTLYAGALMKMDCPLACSNNSSRYGAGLLAAVMWFAVPTKLNLCTARLMLRIMCDRS